MNHRIILKKKTTPASYTHWIRPVILFVGCLAWIFVVAKISSLPALTIDEVSIQGAETISVTKIQDHIEQTLEGRKFFVIDNRSILLPRFALPEEIRKHFGLEDVTIELRRESMGSSELNILLVTIREYEPVGIFCPGEEQYVSEETECTWLSREAISFGKVHYNSTSSLPYIFSLYPDLSFAYNIATTSQDALADILDTARIIRESWSRVKVITIYDRYINFETMNGMILIQEDHGTEYVSAVLGHIRKLYTQDRFEYIDMRHNALYFKRYQESIENIDNAQEISQ